MPEVRLKREPEHPSLARQANVLHRSPVGGSPNPGYHRATMRGLTDEQKGALAPSPAAPTAAGRNRLDSIDLLRGLVMVIMALDHVRDYFSSANFVVPIDPVDVSKTTVALFFTRWITHFCAPTFVFLAGAGAFLYGARGRSKRALSWFLVTRGLWLVLLEVTWVRFGWNFHLNYQRELGGGVIWAIGWSMVAMSVLVYLPTSAVAVIGLSVVAFHNLFDSKTAADTGLPPWLWHLFHASGPRFAVTDPLPGWISSLLQKADVWKWFDGVQFGSGYGLGPWLGVMASGYAFGAFFLLEPKERFRQLLGLGVALMLLFVALRANNLYGDPPTIESVPGKARVIHPEAPGPWSNQATRAATVLSFLNCQKYPPSLLFLLMTLGPGITALALFEYARGPLARFFIVFGRVPLFYYLLHIPLIHGLMVGIDYWRYGWSPFRENAPWTIGEVKDFPPGYGYSLPVVYLVWLGVVLFLFPLCWWYGGIKRRYRWTWLSYL
jgi:uncharacterized membrane protein